MNMDELFIKEIKINEIRNLKDLVIPLAGDVKKNLIITGKNGSGKTTLLKELRQFLSCWQSGYFADYDNQLNKIEAYRKEKTRLLANYNINDPKILEYENAITSVENWFKTLGGTKIEFNKPLGFLQNKIHSGDYIIAFFEAKRNTSFNSPTGINKIQLQQVYNIDNSARGQFIQYIVNLKADRSFARDDNETETVTKIDQWFQDFEKNLSQLFDNDQIKLQFDRKNYNFNIIEGTKEPYNLNQLSDGYSAILSIVSDLIMRMEEHKIKNYDVQGVVLIDEIETHLHIELQKKVLPFLTSFFPNIQFIVTTHSPFVLSSIENAVICDLEKRIVTSDLSGYSYDAIIESYFDSDKYSIELKHKVEEYEILCSKRDTLSESENEHFVLLEKYLNDTPKFFSDELAVKLQQIKLKTLKRI